MVDELSVNITIIIIIIIVYLKVIRMAR